MDILWNQSTLKRPPTTTWKLTSNNFSTKSFFKLLYKIYIEIKSQNILKKEAALLSRLIYRMKRKFRHDKGLRNIEKVNRALLNCLRMSLENDYKYLIDNTIVNNNLIKLPTKQMLQYVLTRTRGFCMLICRIEKVSIAAATFFKTRIQLGQAWAISILVYSTISRIWMLSRDIIKRCCMWYSKIFPFLSQLSQIGVNWLPKNYQLPSDLKNCISVSWSEEPIQSLFVKKHSVDTIFNLIKHQNASDDKFDQTIELKNNKNEAISIKTMSNEDTLHVSNDIGVPISRNSMKRSKSSKKSRKLIIPNIAEEDLSQLLTLDSYLNLDKLQWTIIKKVINKYLLKMNNSTDLKQKNIILKKVNKILHAIC